MNDNNLDLRGSIRNLKNIAKILDAAKFNPQMNALEKFLDGIKVDKPLEPPQDVLKQLLIKFLRGEENFSARELRNLPFIIYNPQITSRDTAKILRLLDFSRASHLRRVLSVYLTNYDDSTKTEQLRQLLNNLRNVEAVSLKKIFAARDKLFGDNRFANMTKLFAQNLSVNDSLEAIGLSDFYKTSNFIQIALKIFFRSDVANLAGQMKLLTELDAEFDAYKNIFPAVADALIQTVYHSGQFKEQCIQIFYKQLGDPRFGNGRFNWENVSPKSRDIFSHWLSAEDLEVFFKIISQTAVDRMWRYREKFWRAYLPYITNTKIFFGSTARSVAAKLEGVKLHYGNLQNAVDKSVFVFQIGRYIFSEWSHNGKLRVYEPHTHTDLFNTVENFFENDSISRNVLIKNFVEEWIHHSPENYFWQHKVSEWLKVNCGIYKTQDDWRLTD